MRRTPVAGISPDCLSDLRIDMWLAHDLDAGDEQRARAHVAGCAACAGRVRQIEAERGAPPAAPDLEQLRRAAERAPERAPERSRARAASGWRRAWPPLIVAGAAAVAAAVLVPRPRTPPEPTGIKGPARVGFFVKHGEDVRRGGPAETLSPGDLVRFTYSTTEPLYLAIVGRDAAARASVYFPANGDAMPVVPAARDAELPRATTLDDTLGDESVYALFCREAIDLQPVRRALEADASRAPAPPGCQVDRVAWTKVRAP